MDSVVLLHGFTGTPASWDAVIEAAPAGARCWAPPLPGHDRSAPCEPTFVENVDAIAKKISAAGMRGCHLIGYSLGARLALGLLIEHPDIASRATLIGAHFGLEGDAARRERRDRDRVWATLLRQRGIATFVREWESLPLFATQKRCSREQLARQRSRRLSHQAASLARSLETVGLAEMPDYSVRLGEIAAEVELVTGALDAKFTTLAERAVSHNLRLRHRPVADVGHNVALEAPEAIWPASVRGCDT